MMSHPLQNVRASSQAVNRENMLKAMGKKKTDDVKNILENYREILQLVKVDEDRTAPVKVQMAEQEQLEMGVRATNLVRGGESLMKLTEDLKRFFFLNDFQFITQSVQKAREADLAVIKDKQTRMITVYKEMQAELHDMEDEYGSMWYLRQNDPFLEDSL